MKILEKLKEIISDSLDVIATSRESEFDFICDEEKEKDLLNLLIYDEFKIMVNVRNFKTLGELEKYLEGVEGKNIVSKQLINEVLGFDWVEHIRIDENEIIMGTLDEDMQDINIYELSYRCKDWAVEKGFYLKSWINDDYSGTCEILLFGKYDANTEYEAVFKACEWILKNKV